MQIHVQLNTAEEVMRRKDTALSRHIMSAKKKCLSQKKLDFCNAYIFSETRGSKVKSAAAVGISYEAARKWFKEPLFVDKVLELERLYMKSDGVEGNKIICDLARKATSEPVKLQAAIAMRDGAGLKLPERIDINMQTNDEIEAEIEALKSDPEVIALLGAVH